MQNRLISKKAVAWVIALTVILQRISVTEFGSFQVSIMLPLVYVLVVLMFVLGRTRIDVRRLLLYLATMVSAGAVNLLIPREYSASSLFYLFVIYFPFVFVIKDSRRELGQQALRVFQNVMLFTAILGVLQFVVQYVTGVYIDPISHYLPTKFAIHGYNTTYPIKYGSRLDKANGIFFLEPSFFSQFLALAIVAEISYFRRMLRMVLYLGSLLLSFSGTGILLLCLLSPVLLFKLRLRRLVRLIVPVLIGAGFLMSKYGHDLLVRVAEFHQRGSSASLRFVGPFVDVWHVLHFYSNSVFVGIGAGMSKYITTPYLANFDSLTKMVIEYGVPITILFFLFLTRVFFKDVTTTVFSTALFIMYVFLSGDMLQPETVYFFMFMLAFRSYGSEPVSGFPADLESDPSYCLALVDGDRSAQLLNKNRLDNSKRVWTITNYGG